MEENFSEFGELLHVAIRQILPTNLTAFHNKKANDARFAMQYFTRQYFLMGNLLKFSSTKHSLYSYGMGYWVSKNLF